MTFPRRPAKPSRRDIANHLQGLSALHLGTTPVFTQPKPRVSTSRTKPKRQPESDSVDAVKEWASVRGGVLYKNPRGVAGYMPPGMPVGLGPNGFPDTCGYLPVRITPQMVGRVLPVATFIEVKRVKLKGKQLEAEPHQQDQIDKAAAANCITGTARTADDCEQIHAAWLTKQTRDER